MTDDADDAEECGVGSCKGVCAVRLKDLAVFAEGGETANQGQGLSGVTMPVEGPTFDV